MHVYNKQYLKDLKIQHSYLKRFIYDKSSHILKPYLNIGLLALEDEIKKCENSLRDYAEKMKYQNYTIFDIQIVGVDNE